MEFVIDWTTNLKFVKFEIINPKIKKFGVEPVVARWYMAAPVSTATGKARLGKSWAAEHETGRAW